MSAPVSTVKQTPCGERFECDGFAMVSDKIAGELMIYSALFTDKKHLPLIITALQSYLDHGSFKPEADGVIGERE